MDEILIPPQEEKDAGSEAQVVLATVAEVLTNGLKLTFDGSSSASDKVYKCNASCIFRVGDRVKVTKHSGTFIVDYVIGGPATGGSGGVPAGGSAGQVLRKASSVDYSIEWATPHYVPSGGTSGQVLAKSSGTDWAIGWTTPHYLPSGGSKDQVLAKSAATDYAVSWVTPYASQLKDSNYTLTLTGSLLKPSTTLDLGNNSYKFGNLYAQGTVKLGEASRSPITIGGSSALLGFFGKTPVAVQTVASTATVAQLITALKAYGLIN